MKFMGQNGTERGKVTPAAGTPDPLQTYARAYAIRGEHRRRGAEA